MSFHSRDFDSNDRGSFHGGSNRFINRGRTRRPFDSVRGHYTDRGGRYNSFRGSRGGWYNRDHSGDQSPDRHSSSRDEYADSYGYHEGHRDDSFHRSYKEESSSGYRPRGGYSGGPSDEHVEYNFKSESTFKQPRDYEEYEEYSSASSFPRVSRGSNRGSSRGTTLSRIVLNRRPFGRTSLLRSRGFRSGRFGGRFSPAFFQTMKIIKTIRMKNAASGVYDRISDEEQEDADNDKETFQAEDNKDEIKTDKFIPLACPHCKKTYETFMNYNYHLDSPTHKMAMTSVFQRLKRKLITVRGKQREKQLELDAQDEYTRRWYCEVCQLQYKQSKITHYSSYYHRFLSQFLRPRCKICHIMFYKPISYEHHRCGLSHVKRRVYLKQQRESKKKAEASGEQFITLDAVGSGDDEVADLQNEEKVEGEPKGKVKTCKIKEVKKLDDKKSATDIDSVSSKYIKKVCVYYCKLCATSLDYKPGKSQALIMRSHCRGRTHIRQLFRLRNVGMMKRKLANASKPTDSTAQEDANNDDADKKVIEDNETSETILLIDEKDNLSSGDDNVGDKISEDEDDVKCVNRFDKFSETTKDGI